MIRYKLTKQDSTTYNGYQWVPGEWHTADGKGNAPCTDGVLHYYDSPAVAALLNSAHADIDRPLCWKLETDNEIGHDGVKGWCKRARIVRQVPLPEFTLEQKVTFAIRCVMWVCKDAAWRVWAENWLSGKDRTQRTAARAAAYAAAARAAAAYAAAAGAAADAAAAAEAAADATYAAAAAEAAADTTYAAAAAAAARAAAAAAEAAAAVAAAVAYGAVDAEIFRAQVAKIVEAL